MADEREILTYELFGTAEQDLAGQVLDSGKTLEIVRDFCAALVAEAGAGQ